MKIETPPENEFDLNDKEIAEWLAIYGDDMESEVNAIIDAEDSVPAGWSGPANDRW